jgi:hypothetical protein
MSQAAFKLSALTGGTAEELDTTDEAIWPAELAELIRKALARS